MQNLLNELKEKNNFRTLKRFNDRLLLNFASNDYLGLANDNILQKEFMSLNSTLSMSSSASRSLGGGGKTYFLFEDYLSEIYNKDALLFSSGFLLNYSCLSALATLKNTLFLADKKIHASMIDAIKNTNFKRFRHNDLDDLRDLLEKNHQKYDKIIILCEAMYSMDADFANLPALIKLKKEFKNILLYIDEAHSIGALGFNGFGLAYEFKDEIDFLVLTFGKSLASMGAAILCSKTAKDFFINKARGLIYSTALPPINVAFTHFVFSKLAEFENKREYLKQISKKFTLKNYKIKGESYIKMIVLGNNFLADELSKKLLNQGFYAPAIKTPTVAAIDTGLRISLNASMSENKLEKFLRICDEI